MRGFQEVLAKSGNEFEIAFSGSPAEVQPIIERAARERFDTLWIGGGDGTINVLLNASARYDFQYGVIPMGTVNALARSVGISLDPLKAARQLINSSAAPMDVGMINDHRFLCFASIGFDAGIVHQVEGPLKKRFGRLAFVAAGLRAISTAASLPEFQLRTFESPTPPGEPGHDSNSGSPMSGRSLILSNVCNYAGFRMFHKVRPSSGAMELYVFRDSKVWPMLRSCGDVVLRRKIGPRSAIVPAMVNGFEITSDKPMFLQVDGEPTSLGENTHYKFACLPSAARVLIPEA